MLREYDVVHVYNLEMSVDYQAILVSLHDDGTALVRSEITGKEYNVEISDLHEIGEAQHNAHSTLGESATSQAVINTEILSTSDGVPPSAPARVA